jgi:ethanolamine utilization cobalamin adenosyltransferase
VEVATRHARVLSRDTDYLDRGKFFPGSHHGVLVLRVQSIAAEAEILALQRFLPRHYRVCRGNIVALYAEHATIIDRTGERTIELPPTR